MPFGDQRQHYCVSVAHANRTNVAIVPPEHVQGNKTGLHEGMPRVKLGRCSRRRKRHTEQSLTDFRLLYSCADSRQPPPERNDSVNSIRLTIRRRPEILICQKACNRKRAFDSRMTVGTVGGSILGSLLCSVTNYHRIFLPS